MVTAEALDAQIAEAAKILKQAKYAIAFTGAGISLESGIPTFRDTDGLWSKYDVNDLDISRFTADPAKSWNTIKECFYYFMKEKDIRPNHAHISIAKMEERGIIKDVVTQNIDGLHQMAGSKRVWEFHGTTATATCQKCGQQIQIGEVDLSETVPSCPECEGVLKPDFVFFGEGIPADTYDKSMKAAKKADVCILVGTSAVVMPAGMIPIIVKQNGGKVIEINPSSSAITQEYTDIHIPLGAVEAFTRLDEAMSKL